MTTSDEHMWLVPFTDGQDHLLTIDMGQNTHLVGLKFWNYNKSTDDSFRGVCRQTYFLKLFNGTYPCFEISLSRGIHVHK